MFLAKFAMSFVSAPEHEEQANQASREPPRIVTSEYLRKQQWKYHNVRSSRNPCDTQFRAYVDLLALCSSTQYLTDGPSSRAPDTPSGTPCSFPGNWDFEYDGNKFFWRDIHHSQGSAVLWSSKTANHVVIAIKEKENASNLLNTRIQGKYLNGTFLNTHIYREAESLYETLESTGFMGILRPMNLRNSPHTNRANFGFILTGHKEAGGVAAALGMILISRGHTVREVVTFGMPKIITESSVKQWDSRLRLTRIVNEGDIMPQTPLSLSLLHENWAHFGREVLLKKNGNHTEEISNGVNDSFIHQLLIRGPEPIWNYWWTSGVAGEMHHPILYFDKEYQGHPKVDDYTDALLFCLHRILTSKKIRTHHHSHKKSRVRKPSAWHLAVVLVVRMIVSFVELALGITGPAKSSDDDAEILSPISPSISKNVNFKRVNATSAYTFIFQDNVIHGNARAPSTQYAGESPTDSLYDAIDRCEYGIRCANCTLFRREHFVNYGAMVLHPRAAKRGIGHVKKGKVKNAAANSLRKETEEQVKRAAAKGKSKKSPVKHAMPVLPTQRNDAREWSKQRTTLYHFER